MKGATDRDSERIRYVFISIHAPREGSDVLSYLSDDLELTISIHAPREGSDKGNLGNYLPDVKFQSTLPVKGATQAVQRSRQVCHISIHAPREGSDTGIAAAADCCIIFQSTLPVKGATLNMARIMSASSLFQSTLPVKGATKLDDKTKGYDDISIHAPREGSDSPAQSPRQARHIALFFANLYIKAKKLLIIFVIQTALNHVR